MWVLTVATARSQILLPVEPTILVPLEFENKSNAKFVSIGEGEYERASSSWPFAGIAITSSELIVRARIHGAKVKAV